jgi:hypothetical protein
MNHTAILQTLNRVINGVIFPAEPFAETAQKWDGKPIIYAQDHPNMDALNSNFEAEIARIGGREVGYIQNSRIEIPGHPRLVADAVITDPDVDAKINSGFISLSTGFYASDDKVRITGNVTPNHVLVFDESLLDQPRDLGSGFLNKFLNKDDYYNNTIIKEITRSNMTDPIDKGTKPPETLTAEQIAKLDKIDVEQFLNMQKQFTDKLTQAQAVMDEQYNKIKTQEAKINAFTQMEKDKAWERLVPKLPKGLVTGEEIKRSREWLNKDPEGFLSNVIDIMGREHTSALQEQGRQYLQNVRQTINEKTNNLCSAIYVNGEEVH